jgi:hypothetical protein
MLHNESDNGGGEDGEGTVVDDDDDDGRWRRRWHLLFDGLANLHQLHREGLQHLQDRTGQDRTGQDRTGQDSRQAEKNDG